MVEEQPITYDNWKTILFYDKLTDKILHRHMTPNPSQEEIEDTLNEPDLFKNRVTNDDLSNIATIIMDDDENGLESSDVCIINGQLEKQYHLVLSCTAADTDGDGLPDIDGDGQETTEFTCKVVRHDDHNQVIDWSGQAEAKTTRGKLLGTVSGLFNIANGVGTFTLRSAPETVRELVVVARLAESIGVQSHRAGYSNAVRMNFR